MAKSSTAKQAAKTKASGAARSAKSVSQVVPKSGNTSAKKSVTARPGQKQPMKKDAKPAGKKDAQPIGKKTGTSVSKNNIAKPSSKKTAASVSAAKSPATTKQQLTKAIKNKPAAPSKAVGKSKDTTQSTKKTIMPNKSVKTPTSKAEDKPKTAVKAKPEASTAKKKETVKAPVKTPAAAKEVKMSANPKASAKIVDPPTPRASVPTPVAPVEQTPKDLVESMTTVSTIGEVASEEEGRQESSPAPIRRARPKVQYSDKDLAMFKKIIDDARAEAVEEFQILRQNLEDITSSELADENASYSMHMAEQGTEAQEKEKIYAQVQRLNDYIRKLDEALIRIKEKTYGICRVCGCLIAKERLIAVPITTLSASYKIQKKCPEDGIDRIIAPH